VDLHTGTPASTPTGAEVIEGGGAYLMPGLADMHTHLDRDREFELYLANGVTTLRALNANSKVLEVSKKVQSGELIGPRIYTAAMVGGFPPSQSHSADISFPEGTATHGFQISRSRLVRVLISTLPGVFGIALVLWTPDQAR
jgi:hypothetical protein